MSSTLHAAPRSAHPFEDQHGPGPTGPVESLAFLVTDDELLVLLADEPGAMFKLYPEGEPSLSVGAKAAVRRSLVARRALADTGEELALVEPWAGLVRALLGGGTFARVTPDEDDRSALVVLDGDEATFSLRRSPTGVHTVTITPEGSALGVLAGELWREQAQGADAGTVDGTTEETAASHVRLPAVAVAAGRAALAQGATDEARQVLGDDAFALLEPTSAVRRIELVETAGAAIGGLDLDLLDAGPAGWVEVAFADDPADVVVRAIGDAALEAALGEALDQARGRAAQAYS